MGQTVVGPDFSGTRQYGVVSISDSDYRLGDEVFVGGSDPEEYAEIFSWPITRIISGVQSGEVTGTLLRPELRRTGARVRFAGTMEFAPGQSSEIFIERNLHGVYYGSVVRYLNSFAYTVEGVSEKPIAAVPLPGGLPLAAGALVALGLVARRRLWLTA